MKFQLIALVIRGFPWTDPPGEGWPELWTDQPNTFSSKCWSQWTWPLLRLQHYTDPLRALCRDCVGSNYILIMVYSA